MELKTKIRLLSDHLLVYPIQAKRLANSNIILTSLSDPTAPGEGLVVLAGPGRVDDKGNFIPNPYKFKDRIIFIKSDSRTVTIDGDRLFVIRSSDVLCKNVVGS